MPYRILHSQEEVADYAQSLDDRWPERPQIIEHISAQLADHAATLSSPLHVVELCCGAGKLAEHLLANHPTLIYTGVDVSGPALEFTRNRLAPYASRVTLIEANLNDDGWQVEIQRPIHAIISMQSVHDLGGEADVARIYAIAKDLLAPNGLFLNADLLPSTDPAAPPHPGRFPIAHHLELLRRAGFARQFNTLQAGGFAAFAAYAPGTV